MVAALFFTAGILSGCGDDDKGTAPEIEIYKPQTSVENVLDNLVEAYERREMLEYEKLFDPMNFHFVFSVQDTEENPDLPEEYDFLDDQASTKSMFEDEDVESITVDYQIGAPVLATEGDLGSHDFPAGTMKVTVSEVYLTVEARTEGSGESTFYEVEGDQAIFFLHPHPTKRVNGLPVWYVVEWRDVTIGRVTLSEFGNTDMMTITTSWGTIKNNYR